jgi:hypothetical protein
MYSPRYDSTSWQSYMYWASWSCCIWKSEFCYRCYRWYLHCTLSWSLTMIGPYHNLGYLHFIPDTWGKRIRYGHLVHGLIWFIIWTELNYLVWQQFRSCWVLAESRMNSFNCYQHQLLIWNVFCQSDVRLMWCLSSDYAQSPLLSGWWAVLVMPFTEGWVSWLMYSLWAILHSCTVISLHIQYCRRPFY